MFFFFGHILSHLIVPQSNEATAPMFTFEVKHGVKWLKIFHQKAPNFFDNINDAEYSLKEGMFSILKVIGSQYKIHGRFEFLLEYPGFGFNRWLQNIFPLEELSVCNGKLVEGFEAINLTWNYIEGVQDSAFLGLGLSNDGGSTLIDGVSSGWYFAIGQANRNWGYGAIAGPFNNNSIEEVLLWVRVSDFSFEKRCSSLRVQTVLIPSLIEI